MPSNAAFSVLDAAWPGEFLGADAVAVAAKTTYTDITNAVEMLRNDGATTGNFIGGTKGGLIKSLRAIPQGTVSSGGVQLMIISTRNGTTFKLRKSVLMPAYTFSTTSAVPETDFGLTEAAPLRVVGGERWYVGTSLTITGGVAFWAEGDGFD